MGGHQQPLSSSNKEERIDVFYLGTHMPQHLSVAGVPLFVSHRRLTGRKTLPRAVAEYAVDSGAYTELLLHGQWMVSPKTCRPAWAVLPVLKPSGGEWGPQVLEHREMLYVQRRRLIALHVSSRSDQIVTEANAGMTRAVPPPEVAGSACDHLSGLFCAKRRQELPYFAALSAAHPTYELGDRHHADR